jgi:hypothetical protein
MLIAHRKKRNLQPSEVYIHPATQAAKIFAVVLIITGAGTFLGVVANATEILLSKREKKIREQKN